MPPTSVETRSGRTSLGRENVKLLVSVLVLLKKELTPIILFRSRVSGVIAMPDASSGGSFIHSFYVWNLACEARPG